METNKELNNTGEDLFDRYKDEINKAYERAVREALRKHKLAGNPVAVEENGELTILQPEDINLD